MVVMARRKIVIIIWWRSGGARPKIIIIIWSAFLSEAFSRNPILGTQTFFYNLGARRKIIILWRI